MFEASAPPHPVLLWTEWRAGAESLLGAAAMPWLAQGPRGDGHPVLVLPGLFTGDAYTAPLRAFLAGQGWRPYGWGQGLNLGAWSLAERVLLPAVEALAERHGTPVSLVGSSMGGLFARWIAGRVPDRVRCVVTLGSAVGGPPYVNHVWPLYEALTQQDAATLAHPPPPPSVPSTSIYSRFDGVTQWRCCLQPPGPQRENVEVASSHHGLSHHPAALLAIADRLAQRPGEWQPFEPPRWAAAWYPEVEAEAAA